MKKSSCIQLVLITAAIASCKTPAYNKTNQYATQDYNDSTYIPETDSCIYADWYPPMYNNYADFYFNNFYFSFYSNYYCLNPDIIYRIPHYIRSHFIIRGGFGASGRSVSA